MQQARLAVDPWSREGKDAFIEYNARVQPSWKRKIHAENTPDYPQAKFEADAIDKEATRLYNIRMQR